MGKERKRTRKKKEGYVPQRGKELPLDKEKTNVA